MSLSLHDSIEQLYTIFARYPLKTAIDGCPCCVSATDKEPLHTKPLQQLSGEDLERYTFKAMTTWGDTEDFKHFLPRIFELLAGGSSVFDTITLGKLEYGNWHTWQADEQEAMRHFLLAWCRERLLFRTHLPLEIIAIVSRLLGSIEPLLLHWSLDLESSSFERFVDFVHDYYPDLVTNGRHTRDLAWSDKQMLIQWIRQQQPLLEQSFFFFEPKQPRFARRISAALYWVENIPVD